MAKKNKKLKLTPRRRKKKKQASGPPDGFFQQALSLHQAGHLPQAEALYRQVLSTKPNHPEALHYLGLLAHQVGQSGFAAELINRALRFKPDYVDAHINLGITLKAQGRLDDAVNSFRRALALKPDEALAHYNLGLSLKDQGKLDEAIASFHKALTLKPDYIKALNNLGIILKDQNKLEESVDCFRQAINLEPNYAVAHYNLGIALNILEKKDEAEACFRQTITLDPDYVDAHVNLGILRMNEDKAEEALASFSRAVTLNPDLAEAHFNMGTLFQNLGRLEEAVTSYHKVLSLEPEYAEVHNNLGIICSEFGKLDDAIACYKKTLSLNPNYAETYMNLAAIMKYTEDDEVIQAMENLYAQNEEIKDAGRIHLGFALGKVYEDLGKYEKSFDFTHEANLLKRQSYDYSIYNDQEFFEKIKRTFSEDFFSLHPYSGNLDETPIFILGMPRSGTSLVEQILASHPQVYGAGELAVLKNLAKDICSGQTEQYPECLLGLAPDVFKKTGLAYIENIRQYSSDTRFITDKMPHNFMHVGLIRKILPNAKVIICMRNPMDNCYSIYKNNFRGLFEYAYDMAELGQFYNLFVGLMDHWKKVLPGFMYTVRYEDMVSDQKNQTKSLLDFCGLSFNDACLDFHKTERRVGTASLAQVRQPIYKDSVELWKRYEGQLEPLRKAIYG